MTIPKYTRAIYKGIEQEINENEKERENGDDLKKNKKRLISTGKPIAPLFCTILVADLSNKKLSLQQNRKKHTDANAISWEQEPNFNY